MVRLLEGVHVIAPSYDLAIAASRHIVLDERPLAALEALHAGAGGIDPLVQDIGVCLIVSGVLSALFEKLRIPTIAALLVAGVILGPVGASIVDDKARIETIAHLGLTLLLFVIGLEVNLRSLLASGKTILLTGGLQVPLTIGLAWLVFLAIGRSGLLGEGDGYTALYLALACGFSSTLLVVKQLQGRFQLDTPSGRLAIAMLIFQDIWAIIILAVQPNFANPRVAPVAVTFGGIVVVTVVAALAARWILPLAFRVVARSPELVVSVALAWCFGLGLFGGHLGHVLHRVGLPIDVSVSLEMAALIAGASVASLPYSHEIVTKVVNLRDFFVTLFFVALGMGIPVPTTSALVVAVILALVAIATRFLVFLPLLYVAGVERRTAVMTSTRLAQVSEFCLVILYLGQNLGHIRGDLVAAVIFAFVLTALVTPFFFTQSETLDKKIGGLLVRLGMKLPASEVSDPEKDHPRVVLLGFHRLASSLVCDLERTNPELLARVKVLDLNIDAHARLRSRGVNVSYGDVSNPETLRHAHIDHADVIVSTVPDDVLRGATNLQITKIARQLAPKARLIVNANRPADAEAMYAAGADHVFSFRTETSRGLLPAIEAMLDTSADELKDVLRDGGRYLPGREELID